MRPPLADLMARMMCYGLAVSDDETRQYLVNSDIAPRGFIHGTVLFLAGQYPVNTSVLDAAYSADKRAARIGVDDKGLPYVRYNGTQVTVTFPKVPPFANDPFGRGLLHHYFRLHNHHTLFATPVLECAYIAAKRPCLFCTFNAGTLHRLSCSDMRTAAIKFKEWNPAVDSIAFGGGSPNLNDYGSRYYLELASSSREVGYRNISIEIVPARKGADWMEFLQPDIVDSVISSIEIWDDDIRKQICIGKSEISKVTYLSRWSTALERLGNGRVSSVLLVGLEPMDSTYRGAKTLVENGVIPTLIPYRPYDDSPLGPRQPVDHANYLKLSEEVARLLQREGLNPMSQPGCTACGACSLERFLTLTEKK